MNSEDAWSGLSRQSGLLIDSNLLVLFVVGSVNLDRIEGFKRTQKYSKTDYQLLLRVLGSFTPLYTLAHVMAEVSNLTDLPGRERLEARRVLKETLSILTESAMESARAAERAPYESLGLVDAAIAAAAREHKCAVLTDDLDLYLALSHEGIMAFNFTHERARAWGV